MKIASPPTTQLTMGGHVTPLWQAWFAHVSNVSSGAAGVFYPPFDAGQVQFCGANNTLDANINLIYGNKLPNPSGVAGPCLLLGSGFGPSGSGSGGSFWVITDQAYDTKTPGNLLGFTAGETQPGGSAAGGTLWLIGGASFGGLGGTLQLQGGTSLHGHGGPAVLQGGNSTFGIPGDAFVIAGENGSQGGNVHLVMTSLQNLAGVVRIRVNSTILHDFFSDGSLYLYLGGGYGTNGQHLTSQGQGQPMKWA